MASLTINHLAITTSITMVNLMIVGLTLVSLTMIIN